MNHGPHSERDAMLLVLDRLADTLDRLRKNLEFTHEGDVAVWMDDDRLYLDALLPQYDDESLDLSVQAGRLFVTATQ